MKRFTAIVLFAIVLLSVLLSSCSKTDLIEKSTSSALDEMVRVKTGGDSLTSEVAVIPAYNAAAFGIDTSELYGGGYIVRSIGGETVIVGTNDDMTDRAIRYFVKNCVDNDGNVVSDSINQVYTEDNRVKSIILSGYDISEYVISIPADASECLAYAAEHLQKYIEKSCLVRLDIVTAPAENERVIALTVDPTASGGGLYEAGELGPDGYRITVADGKMSIVGGNMRGNMYGVYDFLEKYIGWRFLATDGYYLYESDGIVIDNVDYTETPQFSYRGSTYAGTSIDKVLPLRDNTTDSWGSNQNPLAGYGTGTMWYHAHSFAYQVDGYAPSEIYGQEHFLDYWTQPCFTDEKIRENIVQSMLYLLEERIDGWGFRVGYEATYISCSMNDNTNWCTCKTCRSEMKKEGSMAGPYLELVNYAADIVGEAYPGMMVYTITYIKQIPKTVRPADNVVVHFCVSGCNNHVINGEDCGEVNSLGRNNISEYKSLCDWASICDNFYVWYYASCFNAYLAPAPILTHFAKDMKILGELGVDGVYVESSSREGYHYFNRLQKYLSYKLMWNPNVTDEEYWEMVDEFLKLSYGDAWVCLREYIDMSEKSTNTRMCWLNNYNYPFDMIDPEYYADNYEEMRSLFEEAICLADSSEQETKIRKALLSTDFLGLSATYDSVYKNGTSEEKALYEERYCALIDCCREYNITIWSDSSMGIPDSYSLDKGPMENFYKLENGSLEYK